MAAEYGETRVAAITAEIAEGIESASLGMVPWDTPLRALSDAFPGGFAAFINRDFMHDQVNSLESANLDPSYGERYVSYYVQIDPWAKFWGRLPSGNAVIADRSMPASSFAHTEFYNDWLAPLGTVSGAGLRLDVSPTDAIILPVNYPQRFAETYDMPAVEICHRLTGVLKRAFEMSRFVRENGEALAAASALAGHSHEPAFVVDAHMRLVEANQATLALLSQGHVLRCRAGRLSFVNRRLNDRMARSVRELAGSAASAVSRHGWRDDRYSWLFTFTRVPAERAFAKALLPLRRQVLIVMKDLRAPASPPGTGEFARLFGLTPAEARLCGSLATGRTLAEAALERRVTYETVRRQLKAIFQKTQTNRQSELSALLARYLS